MPFRFQRNSRHYDPISIRTNLIPIPGRSTAKCSIRAGNSNRIETGKSNIGSGPH
jgi:hypothetical protein